MTCSNTNRLQYAYCRPMVLCAIFASAIAGGCFAGDVGFAKSPEGPILTIEVGAAQLFVDDYLIERADNLRRTLNQPRKDEGSNTPVLALTDEFAPHSSTLEANSSSGWLRSSAALP